MDTADTAGTVDTADTAGTAGTAGIAEAEDEIEAKTTRAVSTTKTTVDTRTTPCVNDRATHNLFNNGESVMLNTKLITWALGLFGAISYVFCVIFGLVTPESIHMHEFLESALPAFEWLSVGSFLLGLVESFLYGAYIGLVFSPIYNFLCRRWGTSGTP
ncbi:MAG: hypothetical protein BMS9Abin05_0552 [Rhodothermia bacterium]|nr:MAG: hypothetical protein BMS9Abin05_0552 [Rhodothermia bacterium]